jgi:hypothetical protein
MSDDWRDYPGCFMLAILALLFVAAVGYAVYQINYPVEIGLLVTVDRKEYADNTYLVFTKDEVFRIDDTLLHHRWNSSDVYNQVEEGATYRITVCGHRSPFWSMYRNILTLERVEKQ